jgi:iron complex transport system substrate-binding protein
MPEGLSPRDIDDFVSTAVAAGEDLYRLDAGALRDLDADLVVTQDLCAVCAVDVTVVDDALSYLGCSADVLTVDPHTLDEVLSSIGAIGARTGAEEAAGRVVGELRQRLARVSEAVAGRSRPRVLVLEWTDPPYAPGHWVPDMVVRAGGDPVLGETGGKSRRVTWDDVTASDPEIVIVAPCGYGLEASTALAHDLLPRLSGLRDVPVWAVDADAHVVRPGPRLVDGVETFARILHDGALAGAPHATRVA